MLEVDFVADQEDRHAIVAAFDTHDLFLHGAHVLERLVTCDRVDHGEALAVLDVQVAHRRELLGAGRVQDLEHARRAVHFDLFPIEVFDGRAVGVVNVGSKGNTRQSVISDSIVINRVAQR